MHFSTLANMLKIHISLIDIVLTCFWVGEIFHTFLLVRWQKCPIFAPSEGYKSAFDRRNAMKWAFFVKLNQAIEYI